MTLQIPKSHVQGLRQWLARVLHLPGTRRAPNHLDSLLTKCGYLLHPAQEGDFVFRTLYSGCFVQKEKANYRLEIRMLQKGAKRSTKSDRYIMKCPVIVSRLGEQSVRCHPSFIQVSRPLPRRSDGGQTPWLLSLQGELVASLEDASLMGLDVDIGAATVTIRSPRQELLQRREVHNTSLDLLPLRLVSGPYAYSFEAACPLASSPPGSEISVHIPKQRLGLVKRGSRVEESLSPRSLQVYQTSTFTVTEDRDFVVVGIPAVGLLQDQPCQGARESPGTQAFYRVDLSLDFAETVSPVHWTVENFFQCVGSRGESLDSTDTPRTTPPTLCPGWETSSAETPSAASSQFQNLGTAAVEEAPPRSVHHQPAKESTKAKPQLGPLCAVPHPRSLGLRSSDGLNWAKLSHQNSFMDSQPYFEQKPAAPFMQTRPAGGGRVSTASLCPGAVQEHHGPQTLPEKADLIPHPQIPAMFSSEPTEASQPGPRPSHSVLLAPASLTKHLSSEIPSPLWPSWPSDGSQMLLGSEPSVTITEVPRARRAEQDPAQPSRSPFPLEELSRETMNSTEPVKPVPREPAHISEEFPSLARPFISSLAEEELIFHLVSQRPQEILLPTIKAEEPLQNDHDPSGEGARGHVDLSTSEPSQDTEGLGLTALLGTDATFTTPRGRQRVASVHLGTASPELPGQPRVGPGVPPMKLPKSRLASVSEEGATPSELESAPMWPEGQNEPGAAHTAGPLSPHTRSLPAPTETMLPGSSEPGTLFPDGQEPMESIQVGPHP